MSEDINTYVFASDKFKDGLDVHLNLNEFHIYGVKSLTIKIFDHEFIFTKQEIFEMLAKLRNTLNE